MVHWMNSQVHKKLEKFIRWENGGEGGAIFECNCRISINILLTVLRLQLNAFCCKMVGCCSEDAIRIRKQDDINKI